MSMQAETKDELPALTLGALLNLHLPHNAENARITIRIQNPGGLTAHQTVDAVRAGFGIDWEARQLVIMPRQMLTTLTPEQLEELAASARAGQSWHAYQAHKKHEAEKAAMQSRINALLEEVEGKTAALAMCLGMLTGTHYKTSLTREMAEWAMAHMSDDDEVQFGEVIARAISTRASLSSGRSGSGEG